VLCVLASSLTACQGDARRIGEPPTLDWPGTLSCPSSLQSMCAGRSLRLRQTVNEPRGTVLGIESEDEVFVICRWQQPAPQPECEAIPPTGAEVIGEAAVYRVDG
jgi:hypothetical protein